MHNCGFPDSAADAALLIFHHVLLTPQVSMIVNSHKRAAAGFTLIEMMIAVAIVAILASIALPDYSRYVLRGKLTEAYAMLGDYRLKMEQYKQDNRRYADPLNVNACGVALPAGAKYFNFTCTIAAAGTQFTATASNKAGVSMGNAADYSYSINQDNVQNTLTFAGIAGPNGSWKNN
jgi:type IV pilus assembly protein PilE